MLKKKSFMSRNFRDEYMRTGSSMAPHLFHLNAAVNCCLQVKNRFPFWHRQEIPRFFSPFRIRKTYSSFVS